MIEITYDEDFPVEIKNAIDPVLQKYLWLCPLWLQELIIGWHSEESHSSAEMSVLKDYRSAKMWIYPRFLDSAPDKRAEIIVHEFVHCFNVPLKTACLNAIEDAVDDEKLQAMASRAVNKEMERITQDFAYSIIQKFNESTGDLPK